MSAAMKPLFKPLSVANSSLISLPTIHSSKISYPYISISSKPLQLQLSCSPCSPIPSPFSLKKKDRFSDIVPCVAQTSEWAQQEVIQALTKDAELVDWENREIDGPQAIIPNWEAKGDQKEEEEEDDEEEKGWVEPPENAKIFVGNLPYEVESEKLAHLFEQAGVVEIAQVIYNRETDQSRGFGFVTMSTVEEAEKAVQIFHRYNLDGRLLTVNKAAPKGSEPVRRPPVVESSHRIYVGGLPYSVDNDCLREMFSAHGTVVNARVVYNRETGRSRGFGFVTMSTETELNDAVANLDGQSLDGRAIKVNVAEQRPGRSF